jgi:microcystin-dependent protein
VWDVTSPADTDPIRQGASVIRTAKVDLTTALTVEGVFPGATPASPVFHWKPRRDVQANRPANDPVNPGTIYYNTDLNEFEVDSGTKWIPLAQRIPAGSVQAFMGTAAPAGWLFCDGSAVSRTTYADLFAAMGSACGSGDGINTFNLPDLRGQFLRGVDGGAGRDPDTGARTAMASGGNAGDAVGSIQVEQIQSHTHLVTDPGHVHTLNQVALAAGAANVSIPTGGGPGINTSSATTGLTNQNAGGNETRPINAYCYYIIKI